MLRQGFKECFRVLKRMNTELMFSSKTEMWATPQDFFDKMNEQYNFSLDVCAIQENAKCVNFFSPETDGLKQEWKGTCWMNPPYGREIGKWVAKAYEEAVEKKIVLWWLCCLPEPIQDGFTITFIRSMVSKLILSRAG